jgi:hypothetical protein
VVKRQSTSGSLFRSLDRPWPSNAVLWAIGELTYGNLRHERPRGTRARFRGAMERRSAANGPGRPAS